MDTNLFFGHYIDPLSFGGKTMVVLLAVLMGGLIGLERQLSGNAAGLRTHILVCVGSTLITLTSVEIGLGVRGGLRGDPGHIAAQIVSGIGFLGAGAIMREGMTVSGLATAAGIWTTAGIGIALGASPRLGELAVIATLVVLFCLIFITRLEIVLKLQKLDRTLSVEVIESECGAEHLLNLLDRMNLLIIGVHSEAGSGSLNRNIPGTTRLMRMRISLPGNFDRHEFNKQMMQVAGIVSFHLE